MSENNIYFKDNRSAGKKSYKYTEYIPEEQLSAPIGVHALGSIRGSTPEDNGKKSKRRKKKSRVKKSILTLFITVFLLASLTLLAAGLTAGYILADYKPSALEENIYAQETALLSSDKVTNILIIGTDSSCSEAALRCDTLLLLSVDTRDRQIKLSYLSSATDVYIPGVGTERLSRALIDGSAQLICDTAEYNFGVRIDGYIKADYSMLQHMIDMAGGVTVYEIDEKEARALAIAGFPATEGKSILLSGKEALAYCRTENPGAISFREGRQHEIISSASGDILEMPIGDILSALKYVAEGIECSFSEKELVAIAFKALFCAGSDVAHITLPFSGTYGAVIKDDGLLITADFEINKERLNEFLYK